MGQLKITMSAPIPCNVLVGYCDSRAEGGLATIDIHQYVSMEFLASLFNISVRRVQQLATARIIVRAGHGQYDIAGSIRGYVAYLRKPRAVRPEARRRRARAYRAANREKIAAQQRASRAKRSLLRIPPPPDYIPIAKARVDADPLRHWIAPT